MSAYIDPDLHRALSRLALAFTRSLSDDELDVYAEALDGLPIFDVVRACREIGAHERFFPRPVVIRAYVDRLRKEAQPAPVQKQRETYTDPTTGTTSELWSCRDCQDVGLVPVTEAGAVISWDAVRGVGEWQYRAIKHHHVKRCDTCHKLRPPTKPATRRTYEDEQNDRRR